MAKPRNIIIAGAAGRDFHNFLVYYKNNPNYSVVCFTAAQIPGIAHRFFPRILAGGKYPKGIHIFPEEKLPQLIKKFNVQEVVLAYSDVSHEHVMHFASMVMANGADFSLLGPNSTMLFSRRPVIAVCAVRTGSGKSQTSRYIATALKKAGKRVVVVRHPMPYGNLAKQAVQRFSVYKDLERHECTIEEREEYEQYISNSITVFAGVDYEKILRRAEREADVIVWDGGNNDIPFFKPRLHVVVVDPQRPGHEARYYPGETNFRMADIIVINKMNTSKKKAVKQILENINALNPKAIVVKANSNIIVEHSGSLKGKKALVIEDGPTLTHGEMEIGAGMIAAKRLGVKVVDAQKHSVGSVRETYKRYPRLKKVLPAMGYGKKQIRELAQTINNSTSGIVLSATPIDLSKILKIRRKIVRVRYELEEIGKQRLLREVMKVA